MGPQRQRLDLFSGTLRLAFAQQGAGARFCSCMEEPGPTR